MNKPLSLWNKTHTRQAILDFVAADDIIRLP